MAEIWGDDYGHKERCCNGCGRLFYPKQGWESRCYPCWVAGKKDRRGDAQDQREESLNRLASFLSQRERELDERANDLVHAEDEFEKRIKEQAELEKRFRLESARKSNEQSKPSDWAAMIMPLIRLCHPDRHGNSKDANDVTRWLLEQRELIRP